MGEFTNIASTKVLMRNNISCTKHHSTKRNKEKKVAGTQTCQMLAEVFLLHESLTLQLLYYRVRRV
jgi:hypothetical protein